MHDDKYLSLDWVMDDITFGWDREENNGEIFLVVQDAFDSDTFVGVGGVDYGSLQGWGRVDIGM